MRKAPVAGTFIFLVAAAVAGQDTTGRAGGAEEPKGTTAHMSAVVESSERKSAPEDSGVVTKPSSDADRVPDSFATRLPGGILFGTFDKSSSPFLIEGSIVVPSGQKLEFGPGCRIYVGGDYATITVFGQIMARGTAEEPILFRSASKAPKPWDWDRVYCRSKNRSVFEHCVIQHCNYGVYAENGAVTLSDCRFEHNSLHGVVARNSDVSLVATILDGGHVLAVLLQEGARVRAESLVVKNNITGIACTDKASLRLSGGEITSNANGVVVTEEAQVSIVDADITRNRKGIVSLVEIPKNMREMAYANALDVKIVDKGELRKLLKPPEDVKSIVLPKTRTTVTVSDDFTPGFAATKTPRQSSTSFMGNVTTGFRYFMPESRRHPEDDTLILQNRYPGEHNDRFYAGLQPELQVFASGRRKDADINLLVDLFGNDWIDLPLHMRKNTFNLQMNYSDQHLVVGDFFESASETSISGRKITGVRYSGGFMPIGRGKEMLEFKLAAGETEVPQDSGQNDLTLYNEEIDSGMSIRQQMTYLAGVSLHPTLNSTVDVKGIIARDQDREPIFRDVITDPYVPDPIKAQTGVIAGSVDLLDGRLAVSAEFDVGVHDTLDSTETDEIGEIAWYNPEVAEAAPAVFRKVPDSKFEHWAASLGAKGMVAHYDLSGGIRSLGPKYFSAGNPYLESDRRVAFVKGSRQYNKALSAEAEYEFEQRYASNEFSLKRERPGPVYRNTIELEGDYAFGGQKPTLGLEYTFRTENGRDVGSRNDTLHSYGKLKPGVEYTLLVDEDNDTAYWDNTTEAYDAAEITQVAGIESKQRFESGFDYRLKYRLLREDELSKQPDPRENDLGDEWQHQVSLRLGVKIRRLLRNKFDVKVTTKREVRNSLEKLSYRLGDRLSWYAVPRKLTFTVEGEYRNENEEERDDGVRVSTDKRSYRIGGEVKYSLSSRLSFTALGRYEDSYDELRASADNYDVKVGGLFVTYLF